MERLSPPEAALDLDGAVPYDGRGDSASYVVSTQDGRHLRVSATGLYLLRAARDGTPVPLLAEQLAVPAGRLLSTAEVAAAHRQLLSQINQTLGKRSRSRAGMWGKVPLVPESLVNRVASRLTWAFGLPIAAAALTLSAAAMAAAFLTPARTGLRGQAVLEGYLIFLAMLVAHEFGHAAAAARGGARPKCIGFVIYLVWPAFFSDVSESWSLSRRARMVVDLGGAYFQLIATGVAAACYAATGWRALWVAIVFSLAGCMTNLNPFFRFDGYWLLGDALGVDSMHAHGRRALSGLVRRRGIGGATDWVLAVYIAITWSVWGVFAVWLATGAYRRLLTLPAMLHALIVQGATLGILRDAGLSVAVLVMSAFVAVRAGRMSVTAIASRAGRGQPGRGQPGPGQPGPGQPGRLDTAAAGPDPAGE